MFEVGSGRVRCSLPRGTPHSYWNAPESRSDALPARDDAAASAALIAALHAGDRSDYRGRSSTSAGSELLG